MNIPAAATPAAFERQLVCATITPVDELPRTEHTDQIENRIAIGAIGEIVEVTTTSFVAQCVDCERSEILRFFDPPPFGSFVKIAARSNAADPGNARPASSSPALEADEEADPFATPAPASIPPPSLQPRLSPGLTFATVSHACMTSLDAGRRPTALNLTDDELRMQQPQIFELITTEFSGALVGYTDSAGILRRHLPPQPPRLHSHIMPCAGEEIIAITEDIGFLLRILRGGSGGEADSEELCAAILRHAWDKRGHSDAYLRTAGTQLSSLLSGDYETLQRIMRSVVG